MTDTNEEEVDGNEVELNLNIMSDERNSSGTTNLENLRSLAGTNIPRICCALLASITTGGTTYAFGLYGNALKKGLHLTQSQLDTISSAMFCSGLLSWIPGMCVDRFGTRLGISLGGVTGAVSLMLYWLISVQYIQFAETSTVVILLSALGVSTFLSCALVTGSVFKIISCGCGPGTKGSAVGVAKGYVGLGAGAYACFFEAIRQPTTSDLDFLPMAAFFFIVAATIPSWLVLPDKANEKAVTDVLTPLHFRILYLSLIFLATIIVWSSLAQLHEESKSEKDEASPKYGTAFGVLFVWIAPIVAQVFLPQGDGSSANNEEVENEEQDSLLAIENQEATSATTESVLNDADDIDAQNDQEGLCDPAGNESTVETQNCGPRNTVENKNLYEMLQTPSALIMLWTTTILVGGGTVETNNMGQMVESLGFPAIVTPTSLALFSVAQAAGRVATGTISEAALTWNTSKCCIDRGVPRTFFLVVASIAGVIAHSMLAVSKDESTFVVGVALSGAAFGMVWPMMVLIVGELFGTENVAANYMFYDGFTSAGGTFLLSKVVAQEVYERHIDSHYSENDNDGVTCYGQACFQDTHIVIAALSLSCVLTSLIMQYITRKSYAKNRSSED